VVAGGQTPQEVVVAEVPARERVREAVGDVDQPHQPSSVSTRSRAANQRCAGWLARSQPGSTAPFPSPAAREARLAVLRIHETTARAAWRRGARPGRSGTDRELRRAGTTEST